MRTRRPLGIWGQILCGFGIFILVVAALLWLFQIVLLDPFYRAVKTTEVKATAETVQHALEASDMNEQVRQMCLNTGINIVVTDEHGQMLSGWKASEKESYLENLSRSRLNMSNLFNEVNLKGGDQLMVARSPFVNQDGTQDEVILYVTITRTPSGLNRMVLLESAITPVDSLKETLQVQVTTACCWRCLSPGASPGPWRTSTSPPRCWPRGITPSVLGNTAPGRSGSWHAR